LTARPGHNILLNLTYLNLEGEQATSGCPGAVLKVYTDLDKYPSELCGGTILNKGEFRSHNSAMKVTFTSAAKATGGFGFEIIWNEFHFPIGSQCESNEFLCDKNMYCINTDLVCDGNFNCGENDVSDESEDLCGSAEESTFLADYGLVGGLAAGAGLLLLLAVFLVVCLCRRKRRLEKRRKRQQNQQLDQHHEWNS
jgi:hypothetical protein